MATDAESQLKAGQPRAALALLEESVRRKPGSWRDRLFLFQLLAVLGQWERALTQTELLAELDPQAGLLARLYQGVVRAEIRRQLVFKGKQTPVVFGPPSEWIAMLIEAVRLLAAGEPKAAAELRRSALDQAPAVGGIADDKAFAWMSDRDARFGPVIEAIFSDEYYWVPFTAFTKLTVDPPRDLRDLVWLPAQFTWLNGGQTNAFLPVRYPGTEAADDESLLMARSVEWEESPHGGHRGCGQRVFFTDKADHPILTLRKLELSHAPAESQVD